MTLQAANFGYPTLEVFRRTTTGSGDDFSLPGAARTLNVTPEHETGAMTSLVVDLEVKEDDGTYKKIVVGSAIGTNGAIIDVSGFGGRTVRLTSTTFTLGTVTTAVLNVACGKQSM